jgi:hypothetical protein
MNRYNTGFREPPWVMGSPKEVMDWIEASHPSKKQNKNDRHKFEKQYLTNLHIKFDFDVERRIVKSSCIFCRLIGLSIIEEDFEIFSTSELILRGLAKAKFKNIAKIVVDGKTLYDHPKRISDMRKTIDNLTDFYKDISYAKNAEIIAILDNVEKATAIINIKRIHRKKEHSIDIKIKGKIKSKIYHTFLNYIRENIGLKDDLNSIKVK